MPLAQGAAGLLALAAVANACALCDRHGVNLRKHHQQQADPLATFAPPHFGEKIANATLFSVDALSNVSACAQRCLDAGQACIAFTWHPVERPGVPSACIGSGWSPRYAIDAAAPSVACYTRLRHSNVSSVRPAIEYALTVPTTGVELHGGPLANAFQANVQYLLQIPVDDMLHWFRRRAGESSPPGQNWGWDNSGVDAPEGLRGSVAGAFLMGAGGIVRWQPDAAGGALKQRMADVVSGIRACREHDGYIMAFPRNESNYHENPDYVTAWLTHGLLEAAVAGQVDALDLLRGHFDWFNSAENLPLFLPPALPSAGTGPFFDENGHSVRGSKQFDHGHEIYLIYQGMIHNSRYAATFSSRDRTAGFVLCSVLRFSHSPVVLSSSLRHDVSSVVRGVQTGALPGRSAARRRHDCAAIQRGVVVAAACGAQPVGDLATKQVPTQLRDHSH